MDDKLSLRTVQDVIGELDMMLGNIADGCLDEQGEEYKQGYVMAFNEAKEILAELNGNAADAYNKLCDLVDDARADYYEYGCDTNSGREDALQEVASWVFEHMDEGMRDAMIHNVK